MVPHKNAITQYFNTSICESRLNAVKAFSRKHDVTPRYENKPVPAWVIEDCDPVKEIGEKEPEPE